MARRSSIERLPTTIRAWLEQELRRLGFSDYTGLTEALNARLLAHAGVVQADSEMEAEILALGAEAKGEALPAAEDVDTVSRSAVARFGKEFAERIEEMQQDAQASAYLVSVMGDDADTVSRANILLAQSSIQRLLRQAESAQLSAKDLGLLVRASADAARTSISQQKWQREVAERAKQAAANTEDLLTRSGAALSPETLNQIREQIYGIAS